MGIQLGPSVLLSLGTAMTTPPLSQLRNSFPPFAFLLMLQIANSFLLLLSSSLHWGEKNPHLFKQALYKSLLRSEVSWTHLWIKHQVAEEHTGSSFISGFVFFLLFTFVFCRAGTNTRWKNTQTWKQCSDRLLLQLRLWSFSVKSLSRTCSSDYMQ